MKRNAFTLIELLAVIVILAIIGLIAFFAVTGIMERSRVASLNTTALAARNAANIYFAQNPEAAFIDFMQNSELLDFGLDPWGEEYRELFATLVDEDELNVYIQLNQDRTSYQTNQWFLSFNNDQVVAVTEQTALPALTTIPPATNHNVHDPVHPTRLDEWTNPHTGVNVGSLTDARVRTERGTRLDLGLFAANEFRPQTFNNTHGIRTAIADYMQASIPEATRIPHQYAFAPRFIPGVTTVIPFGDGRMECHSRFRINGVPHHYCFNLENNTSNNAGVRYRNVGTNPATGRIIDMEFIIRNATRNRPLEQYMTFDERSINFSQRAIYLTTIETSATRFDIRFVDHETGQPINNLRGNLSHQDIDVNQGLGIQRARIPVNPRGANYPSMWFAPDSLIRARNGVVFRPFLFYFDETGMDHDHASQGTNSGVPLNPNCPPPLGASGNPGNIPWPGGEGERPSHAPGFPFRSAHFFDNCIGWNPRAMFTHLFETGSDGILQKYWSGNRAFDITDMLVMEGFPIVPIEQPAPVKRILGGTVTNNNTQSTLPGRYQPFTYEIQAYVPFTVPNHRYTNFRIIDDVPAVLNINRVEVYNEQGQPVSCLADNITTNCLFIITREGTNNQRVVATKRNPGAEPFLQGGLMFTMTLDVQVRQGVTLTQENGMYVIRNTGRIEYTMGVVSGDRNSNQTVTRIPEAPTLSSPMKTVWHDTNNGGSINENQTESTLPNRYEPFRFRIAANIPTRHSSYFFSSFEIIDDIVPELVVNNIVMRDSAGNIVPTCTQSESSSVPVACVFYIITSRTDTGETRVRAVARANHLSSSGFYGQTYSLYITAQVRDGADLSSFLNESGNAFVIPNQGRIRYTVLGRESEERPSTRTETTIIVPDLRVTKVSNVQEITINEIVNYRVEVSQTREGATARNVVITDVLPDEIRLLPNTVRVQMRTMEYDNIAPESPEGEENGEPPQTGTSRPVYRDLEDVVITSNDNTIIVRVPSIAYRETVVITYRATTLSTGRHTNVVTVANPDTEEIEDDNRVRVNRIMNPQTGLVAGATLIISAIGVSLVITILVIRYIRKKDIIN